MYSRKKNIIFTLIIVLIIAVGVAIVYKEKINKDAPVIDDDDIYSEDKDLDTLEDEQRKKEEELRKEAQEYSKKAYEAHEHPKYNYDKYGKTYNKDFFVDKCSFRNINQMVEYEFIGCEVLDNISEYMEGINWEEENIEDNVDIARMGFCPDVFYYLKKNYINTDGTFNVIKQTTKFTDEDGKYLEPVYSEDEIAAVKITVRYKNLSMFENEIWFHLLHEMGSFIEIDGNIHTRMVLFRRSDFFETHSPVYTTMGERYDITEREDGYTVSKGIIHLKPNEEYVGELIYLVYKDDLEYIHFFSDWSQYLCGGDPLNYEDVGTNFVSIKYLTETLGNKTTD